MGFLLFMFFCFVLSFVCCYFFLNLDLLLEKFWKNLKIIFEKELFKLLWKYFLDILF